MSTTPNEWDPTRRDPTAAGALTLLEVYRLMLAQAKRPDEQAWIRKLIKQLQEAERHPRR
jgi:hypothetical protein